MSGITVESVLEIVTDQIIKDTTRAQLIVDDIRTLIALGRKDDIEYLLEEIPYLVMDMEEEKCNTF